ncbi:hypothetical protein NPIL_80831 [Nephila pilipes]|uniref:Uncharacterized protein n=1 Tax=Nephila pilipes TaxID=299642 RepID=A0A8X6IEI2_NEPPI|nr:hypothetical protein NPIL_80831 [Nephila pilipes]
MIDGAQSRFVVCDILRQLARLRSAHRFTILPFVRLTRRGSPSIKEEPPSPAKWLRAKEAAGVSVMRLKIQSFSAKFRLGDCDACTSESWDLRPVIIGYASREDWGTIGGGKASSLDPEEKFLTVSEAEINIQF